MSEIDKPFRFTWDFCLVWAFLAVPIWFVIRHTDFATWYSHGALIVVGSLLATFILYGPVLLLRQIIRSGSRGWFVLRVFLSVIIVTSLLFEFAAPLNQAGNFGFGGFRGGVACCFVLR